MFGITFVAGPFVAAIVFFGSERLMRYDLPRLFPSGELSAVPVPRLRVRTRVLAAFLLLGLLPLAVLSVAALTRADALRVADAATAATIIYNLRLVVVVLALGGLLISVALALLVSASVARPLHEVQVAMAQVQRGGLDVRCTVVSNDEIGAVAEGFNRMVQGLREREAIRDLWEVCEPRGARRDSRRPGQRSRRAVRGDHPVRRPAQLHAVGRGQSACRRRGRSERLFHRDGPRDSRPRRLGAAVHR